ncbi:MAG: hypothetical protein EXR69_08370 [Myxococcales bacterium]|nr:hypothetical protein [Myxococcales bacterium]
MASNTAVTEYRRKLRKANAGKAARRLRENMGTTPVFPVHTVEADQNAATRMAAIAAAAAE